LAKDELLNLTGTSMDYRASIAPYATKIEEVIPASGSKQHQEMETGPLRRGKVARRYAS
jgi:hypothetical protein